MHHQGPKSTNALIQIAGFFIAVDFERSLCNKTNGFKKKLCYKGYKAVAIKVRSVMIYRTNKKLMNLVF